MSKWLSGKNLPCNYCGKIVYIPKYRVPHFKYCSRRCGALAVRLRGKTNCLICQTEFSYISSRSNKAKYCSRQCYYQSRIGRGLTESTCHFCEKKFMSSKYTNRKFCSRKCINKESMSIWLPSFTTVRKAMMVRGLIEKCTDCGYDREIKILGVHHVDKDRKNNTLSNLIVLCPNCHSLRHLKHIPHSSTIPNAITYV